MKERINYQGYQIEFESSHTRLIEGVSKFLVEGGCTQNSNSQPCSLHFVIHMVDQIDPIRKSLLPSNQPLETIYQGQLDRKDYFQENICILDYPAYHSIAKFLPNDKKVELWITHQAFEENTMGFFNLILSDTLRIAMRFSGFYNIHAAGLVKDSRGIILMGHSGSGKSSLALQMTKHGYRFLADDQLGLCIQNSQIEMFFSPIWYGMRHESVSLFEEDRETIEKYAITVVQGLKKYKIPLRSIFNQQVAKNAKPTHLYYLNLEPDAQTSVQVIPKTDALYYLLSLNGLYSQMPNQSDLAQSQMDILTQLIEQVKCFKLTYSMKSLKELHSIFEETD